MVELEERGQSGAKDIQCKLNIDSKKIHNALYGAIDTWINLHGKKKAHNIFDILHNLRISVTKLTGLERISKIRRLLESTYTPCNELKVFFITKALLQSSSKELKEYFISALNMSEERVSETIDEKISSEEYEEIIRKDYFNDFANNLATYLDGNEESILSKDRFNLAIKTFSPIAIKRFCAAEKIWSALHIKNIRPGGYC